MSDLKLEVRVFKYCFSFALYFSCNRLMQTDLRCSLNITRKISCNGYLQHRGHLRRPSSHLRIDYPTLVPNTACQRSITVSDILRVLHEGDVLPARHQCHCQNVWTCLQKRTRILRSWNGSPSYSNRNGSNSDTLRVTLALPWARCTAMTSLRRRFLGSRPSTSPSKTCAS